MSINNLGDLMRSSRDERQSTEQLYKDLVEDITAMTKDDEAEVRAAAAEALGKLGDRDVIPTLKELLKDDEADVRKEAVQGLGRLAAEINKSGKMDSPNRIL